MSSRLNHDLPVAVSELRGEFYIAPDHLGAPHQITNAQSRAVWHWDHDPFGNGAPQSAAGFAYKLSAKINTFAVHDESQKFSGLARAKVWWKVDARSAAEPKP